jgi:hypothetical protein
MMYSSCIIVEGLSRTTKKKEYIVSGLEQGTSQVRRRSAKRPADSIPSHSAFVSVALLAALKTYFNAHIPSCSFIYPYIIYNIVQLGIANFYFITISKDVPFPRNPRLQTFDRSVCICESLVGPYCVLEIHTQVHWFCASCFWLSRSKVVELERRLKSIIYVHIGSANLYRVIQYEVQCIGG